MIRATYSLNGKRMTTRNMYREMIFCLFRSFEDSSALSFLSMYVRVISVL